MTRPRYQDVRSSQIPEVKNKDGARIRVITGTVEGVSGPVTEIAANPVYLDVLLPEQTTFTHPIDRGHTAFAYLFEGEVRFAGRDGAAGEKISSPKLIILGDGDEVKVMTGIAPARFLLVSGKPLGEPIARYGPFVMNTEEEIEQTLEDLRRGTFVTK
jgi:hypothetical protein